MYKIIGADEKEYGPVTADQIKQWLAEGRVNGQTRVWSEAAGGWKLLAEFAEFAGAGPASPPPPALSALPALNPAADLVNGPGIGLIATGALNILFGLLRVVISLTGFGIGMFSGASGANDEMTKMIMSMAGTVGVVFGALGVVCGGITLLGGLKLRKFESYGLCMTACILAMIPCTSPCCLVGLPVGIWVLIVMSKPEVKSQFR
jgi:hypothetical protein